MGTSTNSQGRTPGEIVSDRSPNGETPSTHLTFGPYDVDLQTGILRNRGLRVRLPYQSFQILAMLLRSPGHMVAREELRRELWPSDIFVDFERGLNSAMQRLRRALHDSPRQPRYIETITKQGYRFIAAVQSLPPVPGENLTTRPSQPPHLEEKTEEAGARRSSSRWYYLTVAAVVLAVLFAVYGWRLFHRRKTAITKPTFSLAPSPAIARQSIAVLGFKNASGTAQSSWLSTALSEMLTTEMAAGDHFRTVADEQVARARRDLALGDRDSYARDTLNRIHSYLACDYVVVGSYLTLKQAGKEELRVDARVQNAVSGDTVASVAVVGAQSNLFDLVSRAGEELRAKLGIAPLSLPQADVVKAALPADMEAARLYSQGLDRERNLDNRAARNLLTQTIQRQPDFAPAYSALALADYALGYSAQAKAASQKALDLRDKFPLPLRLEAEARHREMSGEWPQAVEIYRQLLRLYPDNVDYGLDAAKAQNSMGDHTGAAKTLGALHGLPSPERDDPRIDLAEAVTAGVLSDYKREHALAERAAAKAQARGARWLMARAIEVQGWAFDDLGQLDQANETYARAQQMFVDAGDSDESALVSMNIGLVLVKQGHLKEAESSMERAAVVFRQRGDQARLAAVLSNLGGDVYLTEGEYPKAEHALHEAIAIFTQTGELGALPEVNYNLAQAEQHQGGLRQAEESLKGLLEEFRHSGEKGLLGATLDSLGSIAVERGDIPAALRYYREAAAVFLDLDDKAEYAGVERHLGRALLIHGDVQTARQALTNALAFDQKINAKAGTALDQIQIARVLLEQGQANSQNVGLLQSAVQELGRESMRDDEIEAEAVAALVFQQRKNNAQASELAKHLRALSARSYDPVVRFDAALISAELYLARGRPVDASRILKSEIVPIKKTGCARCELEARLELGLIEMRSGDNSRGKVELRSVAEDARAQGFGLIAQRAELSLY